MTSTALDPHALLEKHRERLDNAVRACSTREYYAAFDESPSPRVYGENAAADGKAAFEAWRGQTFPLDTPGSQGYVATERSPYGFDLEVSYPHITDVDPLIEAALAGSRTGATRGPRAGRASAWRSWTGCMAASSSWPMRCSTRAGRRS